MIIEETKGSKWQSYCNASRPSQSVRQYLKAVWLKWGLYVDKEESLDLQVQEIVIRISGKH